MASAAMVTVDIEAIRQSISELLMQAKTALGPEVSSDNPLFWKLAEDCVHDLERAPELTVGDIGIDVLRLASGANGNPARLSAAAHLLLYIAERMERR